MTTELFAGIDAGGTEFKCIVASSPDHIVAEHKVPVGSPADTLAECVAFFRRIQNDRGPLQSLGLASFGPVDLHPESSTYGTITATPKPHWQNTAIVERFRDALKLPIVFETDVNGALLGELRWGAAQGLHSALYVTVGTGVGVGVMMDGTLVHGAMHAEAGHMLLPRHSDDRFHGHCPFHGACLEGLASGPAIAERWQLNPQKLPDDHAAWSLQAHYLASFCVNLALCYSPQIIILGGGVMARKVLFPLIHKSYLAQMNGYLPENTDIDEFIVPPKLGGRAGALGAIALAQRG